MHSTPFILFLVLFEERENKNKGQLPTPRQRDLILHTA
jgi:hypothetical protein